MERVRKNILYKDINEQRTLKQDTGQLITKTLSNEAQLLEHHSLTGFLTRGQS